MANLLAIGTPFVSVLIITGMVSDPVNVPKLAAAVVLAAGALALLIRTRFKQVISSSRWLIPLAALFQLAAINAVINSDSPLTQNIYGVFGRSTGFLCYLALTILLLASSVINSTKDFSKILNGFYFAGIANVIYCAWVVIFGDFVNWSNPYKSILGFLGNPNFIGAFLGMFFASLVVILLTPNRERKYRIAALILMAITFWEILQSRAVQGLVVSAGGTAIVVFFFIRHHLKWAGYQVIYSILSLVAGAYALMGALQKGPLVEYIYKNSVSLRGSYWDAAISMGLNNPITGVGMDAYGDSYRLERSLNAATEMPGPDIITNAAHNVVLDFFAYGGWPLMLTYLGLLALVLKAIISFLRRHKEFDPVFITLATVWVCYQTQSIISINQVGLAIWGWVFGGLLIAYEKMDSGRIPDQVLKRKTLQKQSSSISNGLVMGVGMLVGMLIALPPLNSDIKWRAALVSQDIVKVEEALQPSYFNPSSATKYGEAILTFDRSKLPDLASKYARIGVEYNPKAFDLWKLMYFIDGALPEDKARAKIEMVKLDPLNPRWKDLP